MGKATVDERGRITLPQRERRKVNLHPGDRVQVEATDEEVRIRRMISRTEFVETFAGCISEENAVGEPIDPLRTKEMWNVAGG